VATSYIEALIPTEESGFRWNAPTSGLIGTNGIGSAISLSFSFMTSVPAYSIGLDATPPPDGDFRVFTGAQEAATRDILTMYSEIANVTLTDNGNGNSGDLLFGRNIQVDSAGYAYYPSVFLPIGGDVWVARFASNNEVNPGDYGYATLLHEIGHALGLKHPFEADDGSDGGVPQAPDHGILTGQFDSAQYTVMSYTEHSHGEWVEVAPDGLSATEYFIEPSTPMLYDIAALALQYLYGANMTTRTGNDTYTFDPDTPFFRCIWDAGGVDTISVSNFSLGCTIDLQAGSFSSITIPSASFGGLIPTYDGTDNLSIAFGVTIEKATGGSGADTLIGNDVANTLTGNGGNDTLNGNGGNDRINGGGGADRLYGGDGNDNLNGAAGADRLYGDAGNDTLVWSAANKLFDGGSGVDKLKVTVDLDLTAVANNKILNIETINMTGGGNDVLTLARADVLAISSSTNVLKVLGDAGDSIDIVGAFTDRGIAGAFHKYTLGGGAVLLVDADITNVA